MADELTIPKNPWTRIRDYFAQVRVEMKRVTWPNKQEVYGTTVMVILTTFLFGIYFWICDEAFSVTVARVLKFFLGRG
jgi:preprotein translocase subunit SecE